MPFQCAFCLTPLSLASRKTCGSCKRRSYCSKECQTTDWGRKGQGHKTWCGLECGEEGIDWEVQKISDSKGLGLVALRDLPSLSRIMIEHAYFSPSDHPAIADLMPASGTLKQKFELNSLSCGPDVDQSVVCLRLSRANHSCRANAGHIYDSKHGVKVLFAERGIKAGEEICIAYVAFNDFSLSKERAQADALFLRKWGIICPEDCACKELVLLELVEEGRRLDRDIMARASNPGNINLVKRLLQIHDEVRTSWISKNRTLYDGFQVAISRRRTLQQGMEWIKKSHEINVAMTCESSDESEKSKQYLKNPRLHMGYLLLDIK